MKLNKKLAVMLSFFVVIGFGGALYFNHYNSDIQKLTRNYELYSLAILNEPPKEFKELIKSSTEEVDITNDVPLVNIRRLAETEPLAQFALGLHYKKDNKEELAKQWFKKAVDNQFAPAYVEWAMIIEKESPKESEEYLQQASEKGVNLAKWKLYEKLKKKEDYLSAMLYIEEMAKQGIPVAMYELSHIYRNGEGVAVDFKQSFNWLYKAYQHASKYDERTVPSLRIYDSLVQHYILGVGTTRDEQKAKEMLNKYNELDSNAKMNINKYKGILISLKDLQEELAIPDLLAPYVQVLEDEILLEKNPEVLLEIAKEFGKYSKRKKFYYGEACEAGSQEGCDKYRELNEKEFEENKQE